MPSIGPSSRRAFRGAAHAVRHVADLVEAFGWWQGIHLAVRGRRSTPFRMEVSPSWAPPMLVRVGKNQTDVWTLMHVWRDASYDVQLDRPDGWIIDAGANAGYATRWFADRYPDATVVAVEPGPENVFFLRANVATCPNVRIVEGALANHNGTAVLVDDHGKPDSLRLETTGAGAGAPTLEVQCFTVERILVEHGIDRVSLLKLDVEGSEVEVFEGADDWMPRVDMIVAELHDRFRPGCTRAFIRATEGFEREWADGENLFAARAGNPA